MAKVSDLHSQREDVNTDVSNTIAFTSIVAIPLFFGALAIAEPVVVTVYGQSYAAAAPLLVGLALYRVLQTQTDILVSTVQGLDAPRKEMYASVAALVINIILGVVLFVEFRALGVVIATVIAESVRYLLLNRVAAGHTDATLLPRPLLVQIISGAVMFGAVSIAHQFLTVRSWVDLTVLLVLGGAVYFSALIAASAHVRTTVVLILQELYDTRRTGRIRD